MDKYAQAPWPEIGPLIKASALSGAAGGRSWAQRLEILESQSNQRYIACAKL
jgi:hypothetical protein